MLAFIVTHRRGTGFADFQGSVYALLHLASILACRLASDIAKSSSRGASGTVEVRTFWSSDELEDLVLRPPEDLRLNVMVSMFDRLSVGESLDM